MLPVGEGPGVRLADGQTEAEGVPSQGGMAMAYAPIPDLSLGDVIYFINQRDTMCSLPNKQKGDFIIHVH